VNTSNAGTILNFTFSVGFCLAFENVTFLVVLCLKGCLLLWFYSLASLLMSVWVCFRGDCVFGCA